MQPSCDLNSLDPKALVGAPNVPPAEWLNEKPAWATAAAPYPRMIMCGPEAGRGFGYIASWESTFVGSGGSLDGFPRGAYQGFTNRPKVNALDADGRMVKAFGSQIGFGHSPNEVASVDELMMFHDQPERAKVVAQYGEDDFGPYYCFAAVSSLTVEHALTINNASFSIELGQRDKDISNKPFAQGNRWTVFPSAFVAHEGFPMEEEQLEVQASSVGGETFYRATRKAPENVVRAESDQSRLKELERQVQALVSSHMNDVAEQDSSELGVTALNDRVNVLEQAVARLLEAQDAEVDESPMPQLI